MMKTLKIDIKKISFSILLLTVFLRPNLTVLVDKTPLPLHLLVPLLFTYILFILLLISIGSVKWNLTCILIFTFICYVGMSVFWGSMYNAITELSLPFIYYVCFKTFIDDRKSAEKLINAAIIGYAVPVFGSFLYNILGFSKSYVQYGMGMERQYGMFGGIHTAAHSFLIFSFFYAIFLQYRKDKTKIIKIFFDSLFVLSVYAVWCTYVRSAYLGLIVFWTNCCFFINKKIFFTLMLVVIGFGIWKSATISAIFWQDEARGREKTLETASSGRTEIWKHQIKMFSKMPLANKILGNGLGIEKRRKARGGEKEIWVSHNDFLTILTSLGLFGVLLYISLLISLAFEILINCQIKFLKVVFLSILLSFSVTAMVTNGGIFRFEIHHMFWFLMGCSTVFCGDKRKQLHK